MWLLLNVILVILWQRYELKQNIKKNLQLHSQQKQPKKPSMVIRENSQMTLTYSHRAHLFALARR